MNDPKFLIVSKDLALCRYLEKTLVGLVGKHFPHVCEDRIRVQTVGHSLAALAIFKMPVRKAYDMAIVDLDEGTPFSPTDTSPMNDLMSKLVGKRIPVVAFSVIFRKDRHSGETKRKTDLPGLSFIESPPTIDKLEEAFVRVLGIQVRRGRIHHLPRMCAVAI